MGDEIPQPNIIDVDDANGPVGTTAEGATGKSRLWVESDGGAASDAPGCAVYSNKYRFTCDSPDLDLTASYQDAFVESGGGKLIGFILKFNSNEVAVKLTIDGTETIFDVLFNDVETIQSDGPGASGLGIRSSAGGPFVDTVENKVIFYPDCSIPYTSEVKIEVKESSGGLTKTLVKKSVTLTDES